MFRNTAIERMVVKPFKFFWGVCLYLLFFCLYISFVSNKRPNEDVVWCFLGKMSKWWVSRKDPFDFRRNKTRREIFVSKKCDEWEKITRDLKVLLKQIDAGINVQPFGVSLFSFKVYLWKRIELWINKQKSLMSWKMKKSLSWPNCRKVDSKICPLYMG